jgi:hypothetical protein
MFDRSCLKNVASIFFNSITIIFLLGARLSSIFIGQVTLGLFWTGDKPIVARLISYIRNFKL